MCTTDKAERQTRTLEVIKGYFCDTKERNILKKAFIDNKVGLYVEIKGDIKNENITLKIYNDDFILELKQESIQEKIDIKQNVAGYYYEIHLTEDFFSKAEEDEVEIYFQVLKDNNVIFTSNKLTISNNCVRYITSLSNGWIVPRYPDGNTYPPLPQYLKVKLEFIQDGTDYFKILEGPHENIGKEAKLKHNKNGASYLDKKNPHTKPAVVKFDITKKFFYYDNKGPIVAKTSLYNPIQPGTYDIEIPYEVHSLGQSYIKDSKYAKTWFRIDHYGDRFLHCGLVSAGCVTVTDLAEWTNIYNYLIKSRKEDGKSVGTIEIF